jgi:hypothetical protein
MILRGAELRGIFDNIEKLSQKLKQWSILCDLEQANGAKL